MSFHLPPEIDSFLDETSTARAAHPSLGLLDKPAIADYTKSIREIPVVEILGLVALNDANDSNPFCLVTEGPAAGTVVHL